MGLTDLVKKFSGRSRSDTGRVKSQFLQAIQECELELEEERDDVLIAARGELKKMPFELFVQEKEAEREQTFTRTRAIYLLFLRWTPEPPVHLQILPPPRTIRVEGETEGGWPFSQILAEDSHSLLRFFHGKGELAGIARTMLHEVLGHDLRWMDRARFLTPAQNAVNVISEAIQRGEEVPAEPPCIAVESIDGVIEFRWYVEAAWLDKGPPSEWLTNLIKGSAGVVRAAMKGAREPADVYLRVCERVQDPNFVGQALTQLVTWFPQDERTNMAWLTCAGSREPSILALCLRLNLSRFLESVSTQGLLRLLGANEHRDYLLSKIDFPELCRRHLDREPLELADDPRIAWGARMYALAWSFQHNLTEVPVALDRVWRSSENLEQRSDLLRQIPAGYAKATDFFLKRTPEELGNPDEEVLGVYVASWFGQWSEGKQKLDEPIDVEYFLLKLLETPSDRVRQATLQALAVWGDEIAPRKLQELMQGSWAQSSSELTRQQAAQVHAHLTR